MSGYLDYVLSENVTNSDSATVTAKGNRRVFALAVVLIVIAVMTLVAAFWIVDSPNRFAGNMLGRVTVYNPYHTADRSS